MDFMHLLLLPCRALCLATSSVESNVITALGSGDLRFSHRKSLDDFPVVPALSQLARFSLLLAGPPSFT